MKFSGSPVMNGGNRGIAIQYRKAEARGKEQSERRENRGDVRRQIDLWLFLAGTWALIPNLFFSLPSRFFFSEVS